VAGGWRGKHKDELHKLYVSQTNIRVIMSMRMRWVGHVACMGNMRNVYKIFVGKPEGKSSLVRPRRRWEEDI
jgi:hypothetical protein